MKLDPLVKPRSVAVVGATDRVGPGRSIIESLGAIGFSGTIYPVNPKYQTVLNHTCYPSLTDLPEAPDVVVFSIRKPLIPEQVRLAVKRGARAAVIYDSGFAELGEEGARQQAEIAGLCREAGMAVCGPNCMGILNPTARAIASRMASTRFRKAASGVPARRRLGIGLGGSRSGRSSLSSRLSQAADQNSSASGRASS